MVRALTEQLNASLEVVAHHPGVEFVVTAPLAPVGRGFLFRVTVETIEQLQKPIGNGLNQPRRRTSPSVDRRYIGPPSRLPRAPMRSWTKPSSPPSCAVFAVFCPALPISEPGIFPGQPKDASLIPTISHWGTSAGTARIDWSAQSDVASAQGLDGRGSAGPVFTISLSEAIKSPCDRHQARNSIPTKR